MSVGEARSGSLSARRIDASYGRTTVLRNVDIEVPGGKVVALLGPNGAGKTTLLRVISGLLRPARGEVILDEKNLTGARPTELLRSGLCLIPEGRGIFRSLTVRENLELFVPPWQPGRVDIGPALAAFPALASRLKQVAGSLSGGEQQMLAVSRAYLCAPRVVLADELSMGLAPMIIEGIYESLSGLRAGGVSLLVVEQFVDRVLTIADYAYILVRGQVAWSGSARDVSDELVTTKYLGQDGAPEHQRDDVTARVGRK